MRISDWSSDVCSSDLFDGKDIKGPLTIGATLTRQYKPAADDKEGKPHPQRIALIGDSDFLSNAYLAQLGNQQLGLNVIQWLASRDAQLNIDVPKAPDTSLYLPGWATMAIAGGFIVLLPLLLLGFGVTRWVLRRRRCRSEAHTSELQSLMRNSAAVF